MVYQFVFCCGSLLLLPLRYPFPELINLKFKFVGSQWLDERSPNILSNRRSEHEKTFILFIRCRRRGRRVRVWLCEFDARLLLIIYFFFLLDAHELSWFSMGSISHTK